jgi:hypothetical protein
MFYRLFTEFDQAGFVATALLPLLTVLLFVVQIVRGSDRLVRGDLTLVDGIATLIAGLGLVSLAVWVIVILTTTDTILGFGLPLEYIWVPILLVALLLLRIIAGMRLIFARPSRGRLAYHGVFVLVSLAFVGWFGWLFLA